MNFVKKKKSDACLLILALSALLCACGEETCRGCAYDESDPE